MNRDAFIRKLTNNQLIMSPVGRNTDELCPEEFDANYEKFFELIFEISSADISGESGYGEFDENNQAPYNSVKEFILKTFDETKEGYWMNWTKMFGTTFLKKEYFDKVLNKALEYAPFCEGHRYLVNNNTFFCNMVMDEKGAYCIDWGRAGIMDYLMDFAIMDLNKPYLKIPEKLYAYAKEKGIDIPNFKERFLCMAYFKGIDTLRWHASIDDLESCESITKSINELEERINNIK